VLHVLTFASWLLSVESRHYVVKSQIRHARRETGIRIDDFIPDIVIETTDTCMGSMPLDSGGEFLSGPNFSGNGFSSSPWYTSTAELEARIDALQLTPREMYTKITEVNNLPLQGATQSIVCSTQKPGGTTTS
jgi:hypothetical protein